MLWQKEESTDALYVDIFGQNCSKSVHKRAKDEIAAFKKKFIWEKDNESAWNAINRGVGLLRKEEYISAMECFNKALCLAENKTNVHGIALSHRSTCFYHLKMYDKSLLDIQLAKQINCPKSHMAPLLERIDRINQFIKDGNFVRSNRPQLSYQPNEQLPILANAVNIKTTSDGHKRIIANQQLKVGKTFFVEQCDIGETHASKYKNCAVCFRTMENLIQCNGCTAGMVCYGTCQTSPFHVLECTAKPLEMLTENTAINFRLTLIRSVLIAHELFPNVDELIEYVEETVNAVPSDLPAIALDEKSKYRAFLQSPAVPIRLPYIPLVFSIYKTFLEVPGMAENFRTKKYRRFLGHLMMKHFLVLEKNAVICFRLYNNNVPNQPSRQAKKVIVIYMSIWKNLFNHSCTPNVTFQMRNGSIVGYVLRPIETGEELFHTVEEQMPEKYIKRRTFLKDHLQIECNCELCTSGANRIPLNATISSDPEYQFIQACEHDAFGGTLSAEAFDLAKKNCESLLEKYGRLPWCKEIKYIIMIYQILLTECSPFLSYAENAIAQQLY